MVKKWSPISFLFNQQRLMPETCLQGINFSCSNFTTHQGSGGLTFSVISKEKCSILAQCKMCDMQC